MDFIFIPTFIHLIPITSVSGSQWIHINIGEFTQNGAPVHRKMPHKHTHIYIYTCRQIIIVIVNPPTCVFLDSGKKTREPRGNSHKHWKNMQHIVQAVTWARGPWSCEAVILPPAPLCHQRKKKQAAHSLCEYHILQDTTLNEPITLCSHFTWNGL